MLNIVTATFVEAKPIIKYFNLKKKNFVSEFQMFENFQKSISLIVSGIGKVNAASAVTYQALLCNKKKNNIWLNIGIAGGNNKIGELRLINKVIDNSNKKSWYPHFCFESEIKKKVCVTFDEPKFIYKNYFNDMELSGFFQTCLKFSCNELIHSIKIVSDNQENKNLLPFKDKISKLINENLGVIEDVAIKLLIVRSFIMKDDIIKKQTNLYFKKNKLNKKDKQEIIYLLYLWHIHKKKSIDIKHFSGNEILQILRKEIRND